MMYHCVKFICALGKSWTVSDLVGLHLFRAMLFMHTGCVNLIWKGSLGARRRQCIFLHTSILEVLWNVTFLYNACL